MSDKELTLEQLTKKEIIDSVKNCLTLTQVNIILNNAAFARDLENIKKSGELSEISQKSFKKFKAFIEQWPSVHDIPREHLDEAIKLEREYKKAFKNERDFDKKIFTGAHK